MVSVGHCVVCSSSLRYTDSDYPFGIFWPLCCLFFFSSKNGFWLPLWYLLAIVLSVLLLFDERILINPLVSFGHCVVCSSSLLYTDSHYPFGIFWPLCCLFFFSMNGFSLPIWNRLAIVLSVILLFDERILITPFVSFGHCVFCSSLRWTDFDYPFGIFWPLCCLFFFSSMNGFWLPLWYLLAIVLSVFLLFDERITITPLVPFDHCVVCSSSLRWTDSDYPFGIFSPLSSLFFISSMNGFWLPLSISNIYLKTNQRVLRICEWHVARLWCFLCFFFYNLGLLKVPREYLWLNSLF